MCVCSHCLILIKLFGIFLLALLPVFWNYFVTNNNKLRTQPLKSLAKCTVSQRYNLPAFHCSCLAKVFSQVHNFQSFFNIDLFTWFRTILTPFSMIPLVCQSGKKGKVLATMAAKWQFMLPKYSDICITSSYVSI